MRIAKMLLVALTASIPLSAAATAVSAPLSYADILARPRPKPTQHIEFGPAPDQFGELWLPKRQGQAPVVVFIHGGCWNASLPGLELMDYAAEDLRQRGFAVWNIEYRRLGDGGGYPATFKDIAQGIDLLRKLAGPHQLDLKHVVIVGHSAGGQLALWAASRHRLPKSSPLFTTDPLRVAGVVTLAGIDDLVTYRRLGPDACGGPATIDALVSIGRPPTANVYADTSPAELLPSGVVQTIVSGNLDLIVPPIFGADYAAKARKAGDKVDVVNIRETGHFDLIDPLSDAWKRVEPLIDQLTH
jgi:acetyl esterase/lipase